VRLVSFIVPLCPRSTVRGCDLEDENHGNGEQDQPPAMMGEAEVHRSGVMISEATPHESGYTGGSGRGARSTFRD
jgi:hypothetical protein